MKDGSSVSVLAILDPVSYFQLGRWERAAGAGHVLIALMLM